MGKPKRRTKKRKNTTKRQVFKNKADLKRIKNMIEYKFIDGEVLNDDVNSTMTTGVTPLNLVDVGDTIHQRSGREITARRIFIRGSIRNNHGTPEDTIVRLMLIRWRDAHGVPITPDNVLTNYASGSTDGVYSNRATEFRSGMDIIMDTTFSMDTTQHSVIPFKINKKLSHNVLFSNDGTGTTIGDIYENPIYLMYISNASGTTNDPLINFQWRYSYCDA